MGRDSSVGIATPKGWKVRGSNPGGGEIFRTCPDRPWGPPSLLYNGYRVFPEGKGGRSVTLTNHPHLVLRSWKSRGIPLLPFWARVACYRVKPHIDCFQFKENSYSRVWYPRLWHCLSHEHGQTLSQMDTANSSKRSVSSHKIRRWNKAQNNKNWLFFK